MDVEEFGKQVKEYRRQAGLTQEELASRASVARSRIDAIENGRAVDVGLLFALKILTVLEIDIKLVPSGDTRPTLEDLKNENSEYQSNAPRLGR